MPAQNFAFAYAAFTKLSKTRWGSRGLEALGEVEVGEGDIELKISVARLALSATPPGKSDIAPKEGKYPRSASWKSTLRRNNLFPHHFLAFLNKKVLILRATFSPHVNSPHRCKFPLF
jgi:hypothetical protein